MKTYILERWTLLNDSSQWDSKIIGYVDDADLKSIRNIVKKYNKNHVYTSFTVSLVKSVSKDKLENMIKQDDNNRNIELASYEII